MSLNSSSSSAAQPSANTTLTQSISEKLSRENYILWKAQVLAVVRGARLDGFLDGSTSASSKTVEVRQTYNTTKTKENPAYASWYVQHQLLLSFLLNSVTKEVLGQVTTKSSAAGAWHIIVGMFSSQSRVRIVHLRSNLSSTHKGDSTCVAYYVQMKGFADEMAVAGKCLEDEEVICYILARLDADFNPFVEAFTAKTEPQTLIDLYSQLLITEARVESQKEQ
jgi:hypothetical protein